MLTRGSRNGGATYGLWEFKRPRDQRLSYLVTPVRDPVRVQFSHKGQLSWDIQGLMSLSDLQRHDACSVASERARLLSEVISAFALQYQSHCIVLNGNARVCHDNMVLYITLRCAKHSIETNLPHTLNVPAESYRERLDSYHNMSDLMFRAGLCGYFLAHGSRPLKPSRISHTPIM
ncbi:hypothetical protein QL093DRAFT_2081835 [Fusarium oxysporum]|nr:hypothetical protein QL093DRAFT_2081835 [Fusarium oxysporum]